MEDKLDLISLLLEAEVLAAAEEETEAAEAVASVVEEAAVASEEAEAAVASEEAEVAASVAAEEVAEVAASVVAEEVVIEVEEEDLSHQSQECNSELETVKCYEQVDHGEYNRYKLFAI